MSSPKDEQGQAKKRKLSPSNHDDDDAKIAKTESGSNQKVIEVDDEQLDRERAMFLSFNEACQRADEEFSSSHKRPVDFNFANTVKRVEEKPINLQQKHPNRVGESGPLDAIVEEKSVITKKMCSILNEMSEVIAKSHGTNKYAKDHLENFEADLKGAKLEKVKEDASKFLDTKIHDLSDSTDERNIAVREKYLEMRNKAKDDIELCVIALYFESYKYLSELKELEDYYFGEYLSAKAKLNEVNVRLPPIRKMTTQITPVTATNWFMKSSETQSASTTQNYVFSDHVSKTLSEVSMNLYEAQAFGDDQILDRILGETIAHLENFKQEMIEKTESTIVEMSSEFLVRRTGDLLEFGEEVNEELLNNYLELMNQDNNLELCINICFLASYYGLSQFCLIESLYFTG